MQSTRPPDIIDSYLGAGGEWTTTNNWSLGYVPNSITDAVFIQPPTPMNNGIYVNANVVCDNLTINSTNSLIIYCFRGLYIHRWRC
jgi:hypothetical protein